MSADDNTSIKIIQRAKSSYIRLIEIIHVSACLFVE